MSALQAIDFYLWHLFDLFPAIDVTGTTHWSEPFGYDAAGMGTMILTYQLLVLAPILVLLRILWRAAQGAPLPPALETETETT